MGWRFVVKISLLILSFVMTPAYSKENNFGNQNELVLEVSVPATEERTALVFALQWPCLRHCQRRFTKQVPLGPRD